MKETNTILNKKHILALLLSSSISSTNAVPVEGVSQWYNTFQDMNGSMTVAIQTGTITTASKKANVTTSCTDCIRAGWVWCSNKWNYEAPVTTTSWSTDFTAAYVSGNDEVGQCCYTGQ